MRIPRLRDGFGAFVATLFLAACQAPTSAAPLILGFDDVPTSRTTANGWYGADITNGYSGFQWQNFDVVDTRHEPYGDSGYLRGLISSNNVAMNSSGLPATISGPRFELISGYFTAAWMDNLSLDIQGFQGATLLYDNTYILSATAPAHLTLNYTGIDSVRFSASGGTIHGYGAAGENVAMDDMVFVIPEPSALTLWAFSMLLLSRRVHWTGATTARPNEDYPSNSRHYRWPVQLIRCLVPPGKSETWTAARKMRIHNTRLESVPGAACQRCSSDHSRSHKPKTRVTANKRE